MRSIASMVFILAFGIPSKFWSNLPQLWAKADEDQKPTSVTSVSIRFEKKNNIAKRKRRILKFLLGATGISSLVYGTLVAVTTYHDEYSSFPSEGKARGNASSTSRFAKRFLSNFVHGRVFHHEKSKDVPSAEPPPYSKQRIVNGYPLLDDISVHTSKVFSSRHLHILRWLQRQVKKTMRKYNSLLLSHGKNLELALTPVVQTLCKYRLKIIERVNRIENNLEEGERTDKLSSEEPDEETSNVSESGIEYVRETLIKFRSELDRLVAYDLCKPVKPIHEERKIKKSPMLSLYPKLEEVNIEEEVIRKATLANANDVANVLRWLKNHLGTQIATYNHFLQKAVDGNERSYKKLNSQLSSLCRGRKTILAWKSKNAIPDSPGARGLYLYDKIDLNGEDEYTKYLNQKLGEIQANLSKLDENLCSHARGRSEK